VLSDGDEIRSLLGRYCHLIDTGDFDGIGALMAHAVLCTEDGTPIARGADAIADAYRGLVTVHDDGTPGTQHVVANTELSTSADGTITARSSYVVLQALPDLPLQPIVTGRYVDTFGRGDAGEWRFVERRFSVGRTGNLDHHLAPGVIP
jgi:hypothetical protein